MRRTTTASIVALGSFVVPAQAQQTIMFENPAFQPQGQVFQPQPQPFGNQPVFIDPNTGQPLPPQNFGQPQPNFGQPLPQPNFDQQGGPLPQPNFGQQQPFQPQPQPNFGEQLPQPNQPNYGEPLPQPREQYGQRQPIQALAPPETPPPGSNVPYYQRTGDTALPAAPEAPIDPPAPDVEAGPSVTPAVQAQQGPGFIPDQPPRAASTGGARDRGPEMSAELDELLRVGERYRAASPGFLEDLRRLSEKYREPLPPSANPEGSTTPETDLLALNGEPVDPNVTDPDAIDPLGPDPLTAENGSNAQFASDPNEITFVEPLDPNSIATIVFLEDDFTDGEIDYNPPWRVRQGSWGIDPKFGLRSKAPEKASDEPIRPKELLKVLLDGDAPDAERASQPQAALIETQASIGNAFSLAARIVDHSGKGAAHFIMHQGGSDWLGYRLELRSGPRPVVVLTRRGSNGYKDITKVQAPSFTAGDTHELRWARLSDGQMLVILNGRPLITSRDTVFREDWKGFAFFNAGGDVSIRAIRIAAPVER